VRALDPRHERGEDPVAEEVTPRNRAEKRAAASKKKGPAENTRRAPHRNAKIGLVIMR
jgi:hypothetical protein